MIGSGPTRFWWARASAVAVLVTGFAAAAAPVAGAAPKGDAVTTTESTAAETVTFQVDAQAKKKSSSAKGSAVFHLAIGDVVGNVSCVQVHDGTAGVSGTLAAGTTAVDPAQTPGFVLYVADGSVTPSGVDLIQLQLVGSVPSGCEPQFPVSPAVVTSGDIILIDGG